VIGDRQDPYVGGDRTRDHLSRGAAAIGRSGMGVKINEHARIVARRSDNTYDFS
jgi:hypothetical protein